MALADMTKRQDLLAAAEFLVLLGGGCTDAGKQGVSAATKGERGAVDASIARINTGFYHLAGAPLETLRKYQGDVAHGA